MTKHTLALALVGLLASGSAFAQSQPGGGDAAAAGAAGGAGGVQYKQKTVYDFDDDTVEGDLIRPDGEMVDTRGKAKYESLIKVRRDFNPEMLKSVEAL